MKKKSSPGDNKPRKRTPDLRGCPAPKGPIPPPIMRDAQTGHRVQGSEVDKKATKQGSVKRSDTSTVGNKHSDGKTTEDKRPTGDTK
jgi:hypothetical protein